MSAADHLREAIDFGCTRDDHDHVGDHREEVLAEVATWLGLKAREYRSTSSMQHKLQAEVLERMADKIRRGAVRPPAPPAPQQQRVSREDTYTSPLHHDYTTPHDLPEVPAQRDRRHV